MKTYAIRGRYTAHCGYVCHFEIEAESEQDAIAQAEEFDLAGECDWYNDFEDLDGNAQWEIQSVME
jgi:hypothetical protein